MRDEEPENDRRRLGRVAFWLGVVLLVIAAARSINVTDSDPTRGVEAGADESEMRTIRVKTIDLDEVDPNRQAIKAGVFDLTAGETTSISVQDLPTDHPLALDLIQPASLPSAAALSARITSLDGGGELKSSGAVVGTDRDRVRIQIETGWLSPGRYRIEIEGTEQPRLASQTYLLEIR